VGRLTQLEGRVDLLKGGKLPAVPLKVDDTVEPGDVVRTKSLSKAQITFIDNSLLTLSQEARIAIEEFKFEATQEKRQVVLEIFQGLALAVVNKILKAEEPDFVIKTHTAIVGVRGTEIGMRNQPNSSTILNFQGRTQVGNILPEVSRLFLKAFKVAFSTGSWNNGSSRWVLLGYAGTTVAQNLPLTVPSVSPQDQKLFLHQLTTYAALPGLPIPRNPVALSARHPVPQFPGPQNTVKHLTTITIPPSWSAPRRPRHGLDPGLDAPIVPGKHHTQPPGWGLKGLIFSQATKIFTSPHIPLL
jgi:hypothetical protein